jgi:hypothetical protein
VTQQLQEAFDTFSDSVFRLETLQSYGNSGEDEAYAAFLAGQSRFQEDRMSGSYLTEVRMKTGVGCVWQRVHVVTEPLTSYVRFELVEYAENVACGEEVRIFPVPEGQPWPESVPQRTDFWLFDSTLLFDVEYADDEAGTWLGFKVNTSPGDLATRLVWRDAALARSVPWRQYIAGYPELEALALPRMAV